MNTIIIFTIIIHSSMTRHCIRYNGLVGMETIYLVPFHYVIKW